MRKINFNNLFSLLCVILVEKGFADRRKILTAGIFVAVVKEEEHGKSVGMGGTV